MQAVAKLLKLDPVEREKGVKTLAKQFDVTQATIKKALASIESIEADRPDEARVSRASRTHPIARAGCGRCPAR